MTATLPPPFERLPELARNLWWSWHPRARAFFDDLRGPGPEPPDHSPLHWLDSVTPDVLEARARDATLVARYQEVLADFDRDLTGHPTWFALPAREARHTGIAYFSAEFGLDSALPVYAGGLGVLAGDIAKEAGDLGLPLIGVGFMYPQGYFRQHVAADGRQRETYETLDRMLAPVEPACTEDDHPCVVSLPLPDRELRVAIWLVRAGRVRLYLMDTDLEDNAPWDRELSARLYGGDQEVRIRQEILLGIGGVRLLRALGIAPVVWHANEGHAAFLMVERVRELVEAGRAFEGAVEAVRASTVFTTHTPVPAGHDAFPFALIEKYLAAYWPTLGLDRGRFLALGAWEGAFNMTALAFRLSGHRSAVSRRHGEVTRRMWHGLWPEGPEAAVPIVSITNGVHVPSWVAPQMAALYRRYLGPDWLARHDDPTTWTAVAEIPDAELWAARRMLKEHLLRLLRERARRQWRDGGGAPAQTVAAGSLLDPEALTLGFARRFATYKRAALVLRDPARLRALLTDPRRPVQLVFAGKAHPADELAKRVLQAVYRAATDPAYEGRIAFVEDYDLDLARHLVQGVDVWLNVPRPPLEASGTSGQKASLNGIPNASVLDGWWAEAYDGTNGWAIGAADPGPDDPEARDAADAETLYRLLGEEIVPRYYARDADGRPAGWLRVVRRAIQTVAPRFSARRMVKEYVERLYRPAWPAAGAPGSRKE